MVQWCLSYRVREYDAAVTKMKDPEARNGGLVGWKTSTTLERPALHWSEAHFHGCKYGHTTTGARSVSESCNNVLKGVRSMSITTLVQHTHKMMTSWYNNHKTTSYDLKFHLTPHANTLLTKMQKINKLHGCLWQLLTFLFVLSFLPIFGGSPLEVDPATNIYYCHCNIQIINDNI